MRRTTTTRAEFDISSDWIRERLMDENRDIAKIKRMVMKADAMLRKKSKKSMKSI